MSTLRIARRFLNKARWVVLLFVANYLLAAGLFSLTESTSYQDGTWWATVTGFTVGYGDFYPKTFSGRLVGHWYIITSAILWLVLAAHIVVAIIVDKHLFTHEEQERVEGALVLIGKELGVFQETATQLPSTQELVSMGLTTEDETQETPA